MQNKIPSDEYARILENMPVCCVDVIIANDKKALLVYRKDEPAKNKWWVVGGRILKNEKLEDAVIRKVLEEQRYDADDVLLEHEEGYKAGKECHLMQDGQKLRL